MRARGQILQLMNRFDTTERVTDDTGYNYDISTIQQVFQDIRQFYPPKFFDDKKGYVETDNLDCFITHNYPEYVFDAIEIFDKHCFARDFPLQTNALLRLNNLHYQLTEGRLVIPSEVSLDAMQLDDVKEMGLKGLLSEANNYYMNGHKNIAVEKAWDAFERLKTYYDSNKRKSLSHVLNNMSGGDKQFYELYDAEFGALTKIGNTFRIRHHETDKIDINDERQYDYFYRRCLSLITTALMYL